MQFASLMKAYAAHAQTHTLAIFALLMLSFAVMHLENENHKPSIRNLLIESSVIVLHIAHHRDVVLNAKLYETRQKIAK